MTSISLIPKELLPTPNSSALSLKGPACESPTSSLAGTVTTSLDWLRFSPGGDEGGALLRRAEFWAGTPIANIHHPSNMSALLGLKAAQNATPLSWNSSADNPALLGLGLAQYLPSVSGETSPEPMQNCSNLTVSGTAMFGDVRINTSSIRYITINNPNCCPVNYTIAGGGYGFTLSSSGGTIPANSSVSISVTFLPYQVQYYNGSFSVSPGGSSVTLSGRGVN